MSPCSPSLHEAIGFFLFCCGLSVRVQSTSVQALVCNESSPSAANRKLDRAQIRNGQGMVSQTHLPPHHWAQELHSHGCSAPCPLLPPMGWKPMGERRDEAEEGGGKFSESWLGKEASFILTHYQDHLCLTIVPMAKIMDLSIICSPLSIYYVLVLLVLTCYPILQPQIAKVNVFCLLSFSWFLDN